MITTVFIGGVGGSFLVPADWSNPANWADETVPESSKRLDVVNQSTDQSAVDINLVTHDIINANLGLNVLAFLSVHDLSGGGITVDGRLDVRHDAHLGTLELRAGATAEIEHDF